MNNPCVGVPKTWRLALTSSKLQDLAEAIQELGTAPLDGPTAEESEIREYHGKWREYHGNIMEY